MSDCVRVDQLTCWPSHAPPLEDSTGWSWAQYYMAFNACNKDFSTRVTGSRHCLTLIPACQSNTPILKHTSPNQPQLRSAADKSGEEARRLARTAAQLEVQVAHLHAQEARAAEAERAANAERERTYAELVAAKSVDAIRQEAHTREVSDMQVRSLGWHGNDVGLRCLTG